MVPLHGIGGRQDLPVPFEIVVVGAMLAVLASFVVLSLTWRATRSAGRGTVALPRLTRLVDSAAVRWMVRVLGLAAGAWAAWALLAGADNLTNPIFGFVYVWVWIGLVPLSLLLGRVWPLLNPLRTLHLLVCRALRIDPDHGALDLPPGVGVWPAVAGLFGFVYLELVAPDRTTIHMLLLGAALYIAVLTCGSVLFGRRWFAAADPFEVYATFMAHLSVWGRNGAGVLTASSPLVNLSRLVPPSGTVAFVTVLIGSTAFDGLSNSTAWIGWIQAQPTRPIVAASITLVALVALTAATFVVASRTGGRIVRSPLAGEPRLFVHALLPIALGYVTAHYLTLFVFEGQRTLTLWSDPLSRGWDVFGTAALDVSYALAAYPALIATVQAGAVVAGHVGGIVAAHDRAVEISPTGRAATNQVPMVAVMIGYTGLALLLLFAE
ncbi:hypothetical protein GCM10022197_22100 [Microlunatus spumicola]|uniref:Fenitrothion hydrolase n=1 Tax=Microlunatus spumicola TaxID=81499 RepID=A0ABP6XG46_9ACTN